MNNNLYIFNKYDEMLAVLSNDTPAGCPYWDDDEESNLENGYSTFQFKTPIKHETNFPDQIQNERKVGFYDLDGKFRLFRIKIVEDLTGEMARFVWSEYDSAELLGHPARPLSMTTTPEIALENILNGSRWLVGYVHKTTSQQINFNYGTALEAIHQIAKEYELEVRFRIEFDPKTAKLLGRYVDLVEPVGDYTGKTFEYYKDLQGLKRNIDTTNLATAMIGLGKADEGETITTFESVTWDESQGNPVDKPLNQDWVGDPDALQEFGVEGRHIFKIYDDTDEGDPARLLQKTWDELQRRKRGAFTYEADVILLEKIAGYEHEKVRIGDMVRVTDRSFTNPLYLEARVLKLNRSKSDPTKDKALLGEFREYQPQIPDIVRQVQSTLRKSRVKWDSALNVIEAPTAPLNPPDGQYWLDTSKDPNIWKRWVESMGQWIPATPDKADQLTYGDGSTIEAMKPAEAGADTTSNHTSADTNNVAGTPATTVTNNANAGKSANDKIVSEVGTGTIETTAGSASKASQATSDANNYTVQYAEVKVTIGNVEPSNPDLGQKWVDTSVTPLEIWRQWNGIEWKEIGRYDLSQMGGQVVTGQIGIGAVAEQQLADLAVTLNKMNDGSVNASKIVDRTITNLEIALLGIKNENVADRTIMAGKMVANTLTAGEIASRTITADRLVANTITANEIASRTITADRLVANTITANEIAGRTITANQIASGTITGNEIKANTITADRLSVSSLSAITANLGVITGGEMKLVTGSAYTRYWDGRLATYDGTGQTVDIIDGQVLIYNRSPFTRGAARNWSDQLEMQSDGIYWTSMGATMSGDWSIYGADNEPVSINGNRGIDMWTNGYGAYIEGGVRLGTAVGSFANAIGGMYINTTNNALRINTDGNWGNVYSEHNVKNGTARATYTAPQILDIRVNHNLGVVPSSVLLTLKWVSGATSTTNTEKVYVENVTSTYFDIKVKDDGNRFTSSSYIDVYWEAKRY
jgi:phage minor structural protein